MLDVTTIIVEDDKTCTVCRGGYLSVKKLDPETAATIKKMCQSSFEDGVHKAAKILRDKFVDTANEYIPY